MLEARVSTMGMPDNAGGPLEGSTDFWTPVYAGCLVVCPREARPRGKPIEKYIVRYMETGSCRRPLFINVASLTMREAH